MIAGENTVCLLQKSQYGEKNGIFRKSSGFAGNLHTVHGHARPVRTKTDAFCTPAGQIGNDFLCRWKCLYALEKSGSAHPILFPQKSLLCAGSFAIFGIYAENSRKQYNDSMKHAVLQVRSRTFSDELLIQNARNRRNTDSAKAPYHPSRRPAK